MTRVFATVGWIVCMVVGYQTGQAQVAYQESIQALPVPQGSSNPPDVSPPGALAPDAHDDAPLTLAQLERMALANHPALARAEAQRRALRGKWVQVGLPPNPSIGYVAEEMGDEGTAGHQGGFARQQLITAGKLGLNRAIVAQEILQADQQVAAVQQRVLTDVRIGFYDVLIAQKQVELAHELVNVSDKAVEASQGLLSAMDISLAGLLQTEVEAQGAQVALYRAETEVLAAWRRLSAVLNLGEMEPRRLAGNPEQAVMDLDWHGTLERVLSRSPEVALAAAELERARRALVRACAEVRPDVDVMAAVQENNISHDTMAGVQIGMPLPILNRNQGGIRQARAEIAAASRNLERVRLDLRHRLASVFQNYAAARFEVERYSREILPKAQHTLDLVSRSYGLGETGYLDMLAAQRTYFQTNVAFIAALRELWRATLRIDGLLLDNSLGG
jgi:cobalt-zinc-cadmium efflux system outer membrane protein